MHRAAVLFLLLLVLPLQFSWAAAARYCSHAAGQPVAMHLGHHVHAAATLQAGADAQAGDDQSKAAQPAAGEECGTCHLGCGTPLPTADAQALPPVAPAAAWVPLGLHYRSHIPAMPDRPDRLRA